MTDNLRQLAKREIEKLPEEYKKAINSLDWESISEEIGKKYLSFDYEITEYQAEVILVLLGITDPEDFSVFVENNVVTTTNEAGIIADETTHKIFMPINDMIQENIKDSVRLKKPSWDQNVGFILSGGNYGAFVAQEPAKNSL